MRSPFPKKKSKLSVQGKAVAAALVLLDTMEDKLDDQSAGRRLRQEVGLQWSFITCLQYLSGQEASGALRALPDDWTQEGRTKRDVIVAVALAAHAVGNVRSDGTMLCASHLAAQFKGLDLSS